MKGSRDKKTTRPAGLTVPGVDLAQVEKLLAFMGAHGLEEFEYEHEGLHIRLKKASGSSEALSSVPPVSKRAPTAAPPPVSSYSGVAPTIGPTSDVPEEAPIGDDLHTVKSPIVGTFYSSPSPDADAYVREGDTIRTGQVVCIVEAMKLMNEIESDIAGVVVRVLVENKQPVEYGQPLFAIRPDKKKK